MRDQARALPRLWVAWGSSVLFALLVAGIGAGVYGRGRPMSIELLAMEDPGHIGMVSSMTLRVHNNAPTDATPMFTVLPSSPLPVRWQVLTGPPRLSPGATAIYRIVAPAGAAIPTGKEILVRVNDARGRVFGVTKPVRTALKHPLGLVNPAFADWQLDDTTGQFAPVGWTADGVGSPLGPDLKIEHAPVAGREALTFHIARRPRPAWSGIRVGQYLADPDRITRLFAEPLTVWVYPTFASTPGYGPRSWGKPGNVFGIQVAAGGQVLWIVFSDAKTELSTQSGAAVLAVRSPLRRWTAHRIALGALYRRLGWTEPSDLVFSLLAATTGNTSNTPGPAFGAIFQGETTPRHIAGQPSR